MNPFEIFEQVLCASVDAIFGEQGGVRASARVEPPVPANEDVVVSSVGFASEAARGSVTSLMTRPAAQRLHPLELNCEADYADCDVLGEMTNMMVGRMKNQLLARGVVLMLGTPMSTIARTVRMLATSEPTSSVWYAFDHARGRLYVRLDACFDAAFELDEEAPRSRSAAGIEGDMLFF